jgi:hypothetical protein
MLCCGRKAIEVENQAAEENEENETTDSTLTTPAAVVETVSVSREESPLSPLSNDANNDIVMRISPDKEILQQQDKIEKKREPSTKLFSEQLERRSTSKSILILDEAASENLSSSLSDGEVNHHPIYREPGSDVQFTRSSSSSSSSALVRVSFEEPSMSSSGRLKVSRRSRHLSSPPLPPPLSPSGLNTTTTISSRQTNLSRIKQSSDSRLRSLTNRQRLCISLGELVLEIAERGLKTSDLESALLEVVTAATSTNDMLITPSTSSFSSFSSPTISSLNRINQSRSDITSVESTVESEVVRDNQLNMKSLSSNSESVSSSEEEVEEEEMASDKGDDDDDEEEEQEEDENDKVKVEPASNIYKKYEDEIDNDLQENEQGGRYKLSHLVDVVEDITTIKQLQDSQSSERSEGSKKTHKKTTMAEKQRSSVKQPLIQSTPPPFPPLIKSALSASSTIPRHALSTSSVSTRLSPLDYTIASPSSSISTTPHPSTSLPFSSSSTRPAPSPSSFSRRISNIAESPGSLAAAKRVKEYNKAIKKKKIEESMSSSVLPTVLSLSPNTLSELPLPLSESQPAILVLMKQTPHSLSSRSRTNIEV